jgi:hypothetical protein
MELQRFPERCPVLVGRERHLPFRSRMQWQVLVEVHIHFQPSIDSAEPVAHFWGCPNSPHLSVPYDPNGTLEPRNNVPATGGFHVDAHKKVIGRSGYGARFMPVYKAENFKLRHYPATLAPGSQPYQEGGGVAKSPRAPIPPVHVDLTSPLP